MVSVHDSRSTDTQKAGQALDVSTHDEFFEYYSELGASDDHVKRMQGLQETLLSVWTRFSDTRELDVADIGCGPGTMAMTWARNGHRVRGLDINQKLLEHAREQASATGLSIEFDLGTVSDLPWPDESVDICLMRELLEHVPDWRSALGECSRIVRRPGLLFLSTTNRMCPKQMEFNLPAFSWYPRTLKDHYIKLAETTKPELANFAKYPAYHWFTVRELETALRQLGFDTFLDRFSLAAQKDQAALKAAVLRLVTGVPMMRWGAQFFSSGSVLAAAKVA